MKNKFLQFLFLFAMLRSAIGQFNSPDSLLRIATPIDADSIAYRIARQFSWQTLYPYFSLRNPLHIQIMRDAIAQQPEYPFFMDSLRDEINSRIMLNGLIAWDKYRLNFPQSDPLQGESLLLLFSHSSHFEIRVLCADLLNRLQPEKAVPRLRQLLTDDHPMVIRMAAYSLSILGDTASLPRLDSLQESEDFYLRFTIRQVIKKLKQL